jgi:hypothetical protein
MIGLLKKVHYHLKMISEMNYMGQNDKNMKKRKKKNNGKVISMTYMLWIR